MGLPDFVEDLFLKEISKLKDAAQEPTKFNQSINGLFQFELQTRLIADIVSCRVFSTIAQICIAANQWDSFNKHIESLVTHAPQSKKAAVEMIQVCRKHVNQITEKEVQLKLVDTLRKATKGKIYVEVERARLTKILANIREADGDIFGAAKVMTELHVEKYGTMDEREKVEFILEQMRLFLLAKYFDQPK